MARISLRDGLCYNIKTKECYEKILVTGGTGYIGSHTAVELYSEGFE